MAILMAQAPDDSISKICSYELESTRPMLQAECTAQLIVADIIEAFNTAMKDNGLLGPRSSLEILVFRSLADLSS